MVTPATMGDKTKPEVYHRTLLKALNTNGELKESLNLDVYQSQFKLIEQNLLSAVKSDRVRALQMLQILIDNRTHTIMRDVLTILKDTSIEENLKSGILDSVNHSMFSTVRELLVNKDVIELASLYALWQNDQSEMFLNIIKSLYAYPGNREHMKTILFDFLIPIMLDTKNQEDSMKVVCIDLALVISKVITITVMDNEEYKVYFGKINEYVTTIATLRDIGFPHWHKLWMFLIRLLGTKLHHSMSLMNKLLRIVEQSFKSPCVEQRLNSYECWKELIDNVSLDKNYLCTEKQIKLLLTPLKAKFAYQTELLVKRFDHFIYLMEKLEEKAVLVVKEFLEFCFGEVGKQLAGPKAKQGKTVPELWLKIVQALVGLMGHSHKDIDHCLNIEPQMHIKPVLCNTSNISHIYPHLINAVFECSKLLKEFELNQKRHTLLRCLWRSLFNIVLNSSGDNRHTCIDSLSEVLENLLKEIDPYFHGIAIVIFKESVSVDKLDVTDFVLNNLERFLKIIFSVPLSKESCIEVKKFIALLCHVSNLSGKVEDKQKILGRIFNCFKTVQTIESNVNFVADVWIYVVNEAEHYDRGNSLEFLVWPLTNADKLTEQVTRVTVYEYYERLIIKKVEKLPELHFALLKHFERSLRNDPMLLKNVLNLITLFNSNYTAKEICEVTLDIFSFALLIPTDSDTNRKTAEVYLKKILETNSIFLKEESTIKKLCSCIESLLKHRLFDTLTPLETALERFSDNIKNIYKKFLTLDFLVDIFVTETDISITEKVHAIIKQLREAKTTEIKREKSLLVMGGRASKIANLVKQMPVSPKKEQKPNTPFKVFGSQLKNAKTAAKLEAAVSSPADKKKPAISLDDESNSKFVLINSEVKLDKEKLTEHQKETLKKRREDIPALYQDLSQSVSQTEFVQPVVATEGNDSPFFKKPEVPSEVVKLPPEETELVQELPSLPSSTDSSFDDKSKEERPKSAEPQSPSKLKAEEPSFTDSSGRKLRKRTCNEKNQTNNTAGAEGGASSPKTTKREISSPKEEKPAKKRGRKPKALLDEMKRIANQLAENKNEVATNEALEANKESAPEPKGEPESDVKTKVKRRNRAKPHFKGDIEVPGETSLKDESEQVTFKIKRRRGRKSLGDIQTDELRKSKRKSLPSSKMSDILQFLKPKSLTPSTNAKRSEPDNNTQSELFPPEEPTNQLENPETEPQKTRKSTSDEDEDIIESSQESGVANASLSKLRLSMNKSGAVKPEEMPQNESVQETIIAVQVDVPTSAEKKPRKRKTPTRSKPIKSIVASNRVSAATAALEDLINELDKCESETVAPAVLMGQSEKEETVEVAVADERNEMEMSTEELQQKSTQSQDTESMHLDPDSEKVQVFLDLPIKPVLTDADKEIATMDTATLSLVELEELRSLNNSAASDKTVIEDTTLTNVKKEVEESQSQAETEVIPATEPVAVEETRVELSVAIKTEVDESASVVPETELLNTEMVDDESSPVKSGVSPTCAGTPTASSSSLPSSPITGDTPNRTTELLSNTNDISPIRSKPNNGSSDEETEQRKFVPVALIFDEEVDKEKSPERGDDAPEKIMETSPEKAEKDGHITNISTMPPSSSSSSSSPPPKVEPVEKEIASVGEKTAKGSTGNWIKQGTPTTKSMFRRRKAGLNMSPSTSRIKKLMSNVKPPSQTGELAEEFAEADVLTFKRDVPSPLAIPRSSILKRKHSELNEEGSSPYAKRKRVNFSDPCTTSKKVFLKEDPPVRPTTIFTSDDIDKKFMELMGMEDPDLEDTNILDESDIIITIDDPPIYPELMNCEEDLLVLGNLWLSEDKLIDETILTVGDLARQTEKSLAKLSPSRPMALHVFKLLQNYHQEVLKCGKNIFGRPARAKVRHLLDNLPVNGESKRAEDESEVPVDVRTELRRVLEKAKSENITLDSISPIILDIVGEKSLANLLIQIIENDNEELSQCFRLIWSKLVSRLSPTQLMQLTHECQLQIPLKE